MTYSINQEENTYTREFKLPEDLTNSETTYSINSEAMDKVRVCHPSTLIFPDFFSLRISVDGYVPKNCVKLTNENLKYKVIVADKENKDYYIYGNNSHNIVVEDDKIYLYNNACVLVYSKGDTMEYERIMVSGKLRGRGLCKEYVKILFGDELLEMIMLESNSENLY